MSKERFRLTVQQWNEVHRLPDSWPVERLREVLREADFDAEVDDADVPDMAVLALQDLDVQDAGELVLKVVFGTRMSAGVRQNLVDDLEGERPWEQFADVSLQAGIFEAMILLQQVFPNRYGIPDAVHLRLSIQPLNKGAAGFLADAPVSPALVLRLLAAGMPESAVLNRLYSSELAADEFSEAADILWKLDRRAESDDPAAVIFDIYSSWQWLEPLEDVTHWECAGWPDGAHSER